MNDTASQHHFADRIARLQARMVAEGLDGIVLAKPQNTFYTTGFMPGTYSHPVLSFVPAHGEPALVIWANRMPNARENALTQRLYPFGKWAQESGHAEWGAAMAHAVSDSGIPDQPRIGYEAGQLPVGQFERLSAVFESADFVDATPVIEAARMVKGEEEVAAMRDACLLTDVGMAAVEAAMAAGRSEIDISAAAQRAMLDYWVEHLAHRRDFSFGNSEAGVHNSFWCYALAGDRVRMNSSQPTQRVIRDGELVWVVVIAALDGQHAENERTFAVGDIDQEKLDAFTGLLKIHREGQQLIGPGVRLSDFHHEMMALYDKHGFGAFHPGRIGHGIGLGSHEAPQMGPDDDTVLQPGMMLTYEPNLRIPSFGGLQHSDSLLITDDGFEFLTTHRRDLIRVP